MDLLNVSRERGVVVIAPTVKRLDAALAPSFKQAVIAAIDSDRRLVFDLEAVEVIDSSGLGALVSILKSVGTTGAIAVCNARGAVLTLFKLTRMDRVFTLLSGREEAVSRLAG